MTTPSPTTRGTATCGGCLRRLPRSAFHPSKVTTNNLQPQCKECQHRWFLANRLPPKRLPLAAGSAGWRSWRGDKYQQGDAR